MFIIKNIRDNAQKNYYHFLDSKCDKINSNSDEEECDTDIEYEISKENYIEFKRLHRTQQHLNLAYTTIPRSFVVSLVSQYDAYLGNIIKTIYYAKPEKLNDSQKQIPFSEVLSFSSIDEAKDYFIEKEVESVLRKSHSEQFDWLENNLNMKLRKGLDSWPKFIEVTERRNLFVHCDGRVSSHYILSCKRNGIDSDHKVGDILSVSPEYFETAYDCIYEIGIKLGHVLWRKTQRNELTEIDKNFAHITYDLILNKKYELAINLLEFAINQIKHYSSDEYRYMNIVNLAQCYKWKGDNKKTDETIKMIDWIPLAYKFRLAYAVLCDEFDTASTIMKYIGNNGEIDKINYLEWPLFKKYRDTELFRQTYEEVFMEPLRIPKEA